MAHKLQTYYEIYPAMGSTIKICLTASMSQSQADSLLRLLKKTILNFEKRCSRFLPTSELSRFNQKAGTRQGVSPELLDIFTKARDIGMRTDGLYNPFVLPVLQRIGYLHSVVQEYADDPTNDYSDRAMTPVTDLEIGEGWARIPYGTALDLGGCGKGYIGDYLADIVDTYDTVEGYWLSMGGDVVARGIHESELPITIGIQDEQTMDTIAQVYPSGVERYAVATSTILRRHGIKDGKAWHHIIDPRTAHPAETDLLTASVCTKSLFEADVHATNCIIVGSKQAPAYLTRQAIHDALLQTQGSEHTFIGGHIKRYIDKVAK
jgi:thiamine biosynthesis lipoprotein